MGIGSLPVLLGAKGAAWVASVIMALPQAIVIALLLHWGRPLQAAIVVALLVVQLAMMRRFLRAPIEQALWYSGFGIPLFVLGMMASAVAVRGLVV
jgi:chlorophyll synthase